MANRAAVIEIILTVKDRATRGFDRASRSANRLRKSTKQTNDIFIQFNRNLFTATALLGTFSLGMHKIWGLGQLGADFELIRTQFESQIGKRFLPQLKRMTKSTIDNVTLMREAIFFKKAGGDLKQMPVLFGLAREAAITMGRSPQQFIRNLTRAITNLNIGSLQNLGIITKGNVKLRLQQKLINAVSKGWGIAAQKQIIINEILTQMQQKWGANLESARTLKDLFMALSATSLNFRQKLGLLIGDALRPLATSIINILSRMEMWIDTLKLTRVAVVTTTRAVIKFAGAISLLFGTMSLIRLFLIPFGLGLKTTYLLVGLLIGGVGFLVSKFGSLGEIIKRISVFFSFFWQIISNFRDGRTMVDLDTWEAFHDLFPNIVAQSIKVAFAIGQWKDKLFGAKGQVWEIFDAVKKIGGYFIDVLVPVLKNVVWPIIKSMGKTLELISVVLGTNKIWMQERSGAEAMTTRSVGGTMENIFSKVTESGLLSGQSVKERESIFANLQESATKAAQNPIIGELFQATLATQYLKVIADGQIDKKEWELLKDTINSSGMNIVLSERESTERLESVIETTTKPFSDTPLLQRIR